MTQTSATDVPMATTQKVRLQSSDIRTWNMVCEEDIASSSSSSGRGSSLSSHQQINDLQQAQIEQRFDNCTEEMMHLRVIKIFTNEFLKRAEFQETPIYGQQPTTKKEKQREYYYLRLQFLDIRLQTLTEEMDQLQTQKNQIEVNQKTPSELTIQEFRQCSSYAFTHARMRSASGCHLHV